MAGTRASDADRDLCLNEIESAFADGRIDDAERESRTQSALQAKTLDQLAMLTADLRPQGAERLARTLSAPSLPAGLGIKIVLGVLVTAIALVIFAVAALSSGDVTSSTANSDERDLGDQPSKTLDLHSADGFTKFVAATRSAFGTTTVQSAAIYPEYASVNVIVPDNPRRTERWTFRKGYDGTPSKSTRQTDDTVIDMSAIDIPALMDAVRRAPDELNVEAVKSIYIVLDGRNDVPSMSVYVSNEYNESGYYVFTLDGTETFRYAFE